MSGVRSVVRVAVTLVALSCGEPSVERVLARDGDRRAGADVYADACARCHGADGTGRIGPDLCDGDDTRAELADKVLWGWGQMEGMHDVLTVGEIADVIAYVEDDLAPACVDHPTSHR